MLHAQTESNTIVITEEMNPIIRTLDSLENIEPIERYLNTLTSKKSF